VLLDSYLQSRLLDVGFEVDGFRGLQLDHELVGLFAVPVLLALEDVGARGFELNPHLK
jgi:hypothetical protein